MLRFGNITEIDPAKGYARVKFLDDGIVSAWLQICVMGAISNKFFHTFDTNEQVACLMDDESVEGVIVGALFNNRTAPDGGSKDIVRVKFSDDSYIEYDRASHEYNINVQGKINIVATGETHIEADTVSVEAASVSVDADTVEVTAVAVSVDANETEINSPVVNIAGNVSIDGTLQVSGAITGAAAITGLTVVGVTSISAPVISGSGVSMSGGNLSATGELSGATVKAGAIDLGTHKHPGVTAGGAQTGTPV